MPDALGKSQFSPTRFLDNNRAAVMLAFVFLMLAIDAPGLFIPGQNGANFLSINNVTSILQTSCLSGIVAIGFTVIFILGHLDLSIGATMMMCGMLSIGLQERLGWGGSIPIAILSGSLIGLINGLLVVKARINSFIVTLGMLTILTGLMHLYSGGESLAITNYALADFLEKPVIPFLSPQIIITFALITAFTLFLTRTPTGRNLFLVGGNPETAWLAGLNRDGYLIAGFIICGTTSAIGGTIKAITLASMTANAVLGNQTLMTVLAAVIIGGTLMTGGKGSVVKSFIAVLLLTTINNGIGCYGKGFEVQMFINGLLLAVVVLYEAYVIYRHELLKGQRPNLIAELENIPKTEEINETEDSTMQKGMDRNLAAVCVTALACVAIVAIYAIWSQNNSQPVIVQAAQQETTEQNLTPQGKQNIDEMILTLKSSDDQPLIAIGIPPEMPPRPAEPEALSEETKGRWWDLEFAGRKIEKKPMPESPGDGGKGKYVVLLKAGEHPYWTAYVNGFERVAKQYDMTYKMYNGNWDIALQAGQTEQAINDKPDLILFAPVDALACTPLLRKIYKAGIPCIATNSTACNEAMQYCISWTGPDDWGQFRMLSRTFADAMNKKGGYAIIRHMPGSSPFIARTFAAITELGSYAPEMKMLEMDSANLEAEGTMQLVSAWLTKHGDNLKGLVLAGDGFSMTGALEAVHNAGRTDIQIVAAGNSKTGMDSIKTDEALAITYQSAEGDGALALYTAARWFNGEKIDPVIYLTKQIIDKTNVDEYMPAQW